MLYIRYQQKPKDSFIHSFKWVRGVVISANYLKVYGTNYLYVLWHKPVVYGNFDEQMKHMPICGVSQGDIQISKYRKVIWKV